jgi:ELWxxDGT repeat protein
MSRPRALSALLPAVLSAFLASAYPFVTPVTAQVASLARDINPGPTDFSPGDLGGTDSWLVAAGGRVYFPDRTDASGTELWTSDGTAFGTAQVADLCPGPCSGQPSPLGVLGNVFLFTAESPRRLWRTDGTPAGTYRVSPEGADSTERTGVNGKILFQLCPDNALSCELWTTDGTLAGTARLASVDGEVIGLTSAGAKAFALVANVGNVGGGGAALWASDGTAAGTALVAPVAADLQFLLPAGNRVVLWGSAGTASELWGSDGTAGGTGRLRSFGLDPGASVGAFFAVSLGAEVYFAADDGVSGLEVWASDGNVSNPTGTAKVTSLTGFTPDLSSPSNALLVGSRLLFEAVDSGGQSHVFSAGVASGTSANPGSTVQLSAAVVRGPLGGVVGGKAIFLADDGVHGLEPWTSDGTPAATHLLVDTCPGACGAPESPALQVLSGLAFFASGDPQSGDDLWVTDGTAAGTRRYTDFGASRPVVGPLLAATSGASAETFFAATDPAHGTELWTSDGRSGGTHRVTDIGRRQPSSDPAELTAVASSPGQVVFTACDGVNRGVWTSDGTPAGTVAVYPVGGAASPCADTANAPRALTAAAGGVYFLTGSGATLTLWRTDGSAAAAVPVFTFPSGLPFDPPLSGTATALWFAVETADSTEIYRTTPGDLIAPQLIYPVTGGLRALHSFTVLGSQAFFVADLGGVFNVFVTDAAGTRQLAGPISVSLEGPADAWFLSLNARVVFGATDLSDGENPATSMWATDGTPGGTQVLHRFAGASGLPFPAAFQGALWFLDLPATGGTELWRTDGTPAGTARTATFPALAASNPVAASGRLFFTAADDAHGLELWTSDGSGTTAPVLDIVAGPEGSQPDRLTSSGATSSGRLSFTADDGVHGVELWTSDGTAAGTHLVDDLAPAGSSSNPDSLTAAGSRLFFAADDGLSGREPWSVPLAGPGCVPGDTRLCLAGGRFQVEIAWQDFNGNTGVGHTIPLTTDTGAFWFFDPANVEVIVKVLDARSLNNAFWVFYGALSNVQYSLTVTDTATGLTRRYDNPATQLASVGDTNGFGPQGASAPSPNPKAARPDVSGVPLVSARTDATPATAATVCVPSSQRLCLQGDRFAVTAVWKDFQGNTGTGTAVPLSGDTGYFWFFAPTNVEVVTKVLDGRALGGKFWFFYGALSDVEYTLTVTDTQTGAVKTYKNPSGQFGSVADTAAF